MAAVSLGNYYLKKKLKFEVVGEGFFIIQFIFLQCLCNFKMFIFSYSEKGELKYPSTKTLPLADGWGREAAFLLLARGAKGKVACISCPTLWQQMLGTLLFIL
jgi:hypothetical protein